jgi:hypothetical protein
MRRWSFGRFAMVTALSCDGEGSLAVSQECGEVAKLSTVDDIVGMILSRTFLFSMVLPAKTYKNACAGSLDNVF